MTLAVMPPNTPLMFASFWQGHIRSAVITSLPEASDRSGWNVLYCLPAVDFLSAGAARSAVSQRHLEEVMGETAQKLSRHSTTIEVSQHVDGILGVVIFLVN